MGGIIFLFLAIGLPLILHKIGEYNVNQRLEDYDLKNVDNTKLTADMHLSVQQRRQNLVNGKYDFKPGEYNYNTKTRVK